MDSHSCIPNLACTLVVGTQLLNLYMLAQEESIYSKNDTSLVDLS